MKHAHEAAISHLFAQSHGISVEPSAHKCCVEITLNEQYWHQE